MPTPRPWSIKEIASVAPAYAGISWDHLDWGEGRDGMVLPMAEGSQPLQYVPVDPDLRVEPARLALHLGRVLYDDAVRVTHEPGVGLADGAGTRLSSTRATPAAITATEGQTVEISNDRGSAELPLAFDASLAPGTVYVPANLPETSVLGGGLAVEVRPDSRR